MISLQEQIACLTRELKMRRAVYPKWVASGKMRRDKMDHEIAAMEAALNTLLLLNPVGPLLDAFPPPKSERNGHYG